MDLNELGSVFVSIVPSLAGIARAASEGGRHAADNFSTAFEQQSGQRFAEVGRNASRALTAGMREGQTEFERVTGAMDNALRAHEDALRRVGQEQRNLTELRNTGGYSSAVYVAAEERLTKARHAETDALVAHKKAQTDFNDAVANGAKEADESEKSLQRAAAAGTALGVAISGTATMAIAAFAGIATATLAVGAALVDVGEKWENIERTFEVTTTAMGRDLTGLEDTVKNVAVTTSASLADIATATASLAAKTGLRGGALQDLVTDFADAGVLLGKKIDVAPFVASLHALNIPMADADAWLTKLFNISRTTGVPLNELVETVSKNAVALHGFGVAAAPAAALLAEFTEHGIDAGTTTKGLAAAAKEATKEHKELPVFLKETVEQLEHFRDTGNQVAENKVLERAFGPKGMLAFKAAVESGILSVESLSEVMSTPSDKISDLFDKTRTLSDEFAIFRNVIDTALAPIGIAISHYIGGGLDHVNEWVKTHGDVLISWFQGIWDGAIGAGEGIVKAFQPVAEMLGKLEVAYGNTFGDDQIKQSGLDLENWSKGLTGPGGVIDAMERTKHKGDDWLDGIKKTTLVNELLGDSLKRTSDGKGLVIKDNSKEVQEDLKRLKEFGVTVSTGPDGKLNFTADTPENAARVKDWIKQQSGQDLTVNVVPKAPDVPPPAPAPARPASPPHGDTGPIPWEAPKPGDDLKGPGRSHDVIPPPSQWLPDILKFLRGNPGTGVPPGTTIPGPDGKPLHVAGQTGGYVAGLGNSRGPNDTTAAWLDPKEFVVRAGAAQKYGAELTWMNAQGYTDGGPVGDWTPPPGMPTPSFGPFGSPWAPKGMRENEEWQEKQTQAARSVERQQDRIEDLTTTIDDYNDKLKDLSDQLSDETLTEDERNRLTKEYNRTQQQLNRSTRDLSEAHQDLTTDQRKQVEAAQTPPGGSGSSGDISKDFGKGFMEGIFQELGLPDVFGKAISEWAIPKFAMGFLGLMLGGGEGKSGGSGSGGFLSGLLPNLFGSRPGMPSNGSAPSVPYGGIQIPGGSAAFTPSTQFGPSHLGPGPGAPSSPSAGAIQFGPAPGPAAAPGPASAPGPIAIPDPLNPANRNLAPASYNTGGGGAQGGGIAGQIYNSVVGAGYSPKTATAAVAAAQYESGLSPTVQEHGGSDHWGLFQEQGNYPGAHGSAADQINWFTGKLNSLGGPSVVDADPTNIIANNVEAGGYPGSNYDLNAASSLIGGSGGGGVPSVQSAAFNMPSTAGIGGPAATDTAASGSPRYGGIPGAPSGMGQPIVGWMESQVQAYNAATGSNLSITADFPGGPHGHPDDGGDHSARRAVDISGSTAQMDAFANYWNSNPAFVAATRQLIHQGPGFADSSNIFGGQNRSGQGIYGAGTMAGHGDHDHLAMEYIPGGNQSGSPFQNAAFSGVPSPPSFGIGDVPDFNQMVAPGSAAVTPHYGTGVTPGPAASAAGGGMDWGATAGAAAGAVLGAIGADSADAFSAANHMHDMSPEGAASQQSIDAESAAAWQRRATGPAPPSDLARAMSVARAPQPSPVQAPVNTVNYINNNSGVMGEPEINSRMQNSVINSNRGASSAMSPSLV